MTMNTVSAAYVGETEYGSIVFIGNGHVLELDPPCEGSAHWFVHTGMSSHRSWIFKRMDSALDYIGRILEQAD